jgi:hypothetical protein
VHPDGRLAGTLTATGPAGAASGDAAAAEPVTGQFAIRQRDLTGDITVLVQDHVGDQLKNVGDPIMKIVKQAAQPLKPLADQARKMGMAVVAEFSLDFGGLHLTFTAEDTPMHPWRLTDQRAEAKWHGSEAAEVHCGALIDHVLAQVKRPG